MEWFHSVEHRGYKMRVADLIELLSHADPEAEVRYSVLSFSEYGEAIEDDGVVKQDDVLVEDDSVVFSL